MMISIIGGGAIGGSMAIRLKAAGHDVRVNDSSRETRNELMKKGLELFDDSPAGELTVICTPMDVENRLINEGTLGGTVLDVASVMAPFFEAAEKKGLKWISGHPVAGNEYSGFAGWDDGIFENRPFFLARSKAASEDDVNRVMVLVAALGARAVWIDPVCHDSAMSRISHSTYFLSLVARRLGEGFEEFSGPGYASTTRLSRQNPEMVIDMVRYNGRNILADLEEASGFLEKLIRTLKSEDYQGIKKIIE